MLLSILSIIVSLAVWCLAQGGKGGGMHWIYGPMWGYRSRSGVKGFITAAETTLIANKVPAQVAPRLAIWPGLDTAKGLIQPIIVSSSEGLYQGASCGGANRSQWCAFASMIVGNSQQKMGKRFPLNANDALKMKFKWNETLGGYDQWLYIKDKLVSELHIATGKSVSFYVATECQSAHTGIVYNHTYYDTKLEFSEPNPTWGDAPNVKFMACGTKAKSSNGGKNWSIDEIRVHQSNATSDYKRNVQKWDKPAWC